MIDVHCHLYDSKLDDIREEILSNLNSSNIFCICSADNVENSQKCVKLANENKNVFATVGTHPHEADNFCDDDLKIYREMFENKKVVAVGEIGLDYYYDFSIKEKQIEVLKKQIVFAHSINKPCVFHIREAQEDFIKIIKEYKHCFTIPSMIHSFSGSVETAKIYLDFGFYISINGICTFKNANKILDVIKFVPLDRLLIETDSPYLTPVPYRGQPNRVEYVELVAKKIAEIKNISVEEVLNQTQLNAKKLFNLNF